MKSMAVRRTPDSEPRFRLAASHEARGGRTVTVLQRLVRRKQETSEIVFEPVGQAGGLPLDVVTPLLVTAMRENGISPEPLGRPSRPNDPPIELDEAHGARVALALVAVRPLRKLERMEGVVQGIGEMSAEEALYWFARVMRGPKSRVLRALRILLAKE